MNRSKDWPASLLLEHSALQHEHAPRPLPLFLELVRSAAARDAGLGRNALAGLLRYEQAPRKPSRQVRPAIHRVNGASLRDCGGSGRPLVLVPSLINPPNVLDLDPEVSLADACAGMGRSVLLLDWGSASDRSTLSVAGHVTELLLPLLGQLGQPPALAGYCLGGTMAIAAANLTPVERIVTMASPWNFSLYPEEGRSALASLWEHARAAAISLGALPMEVLQSAFWSLDPERTVAKFAKFAALPSDSPQGRRFVALEDWANEGEPLPIPAARELIKDFFANDLPGTGKWTIGAQVITDALDIPALHLTAGEDRIAPAVTAPIGSGTVINIDSGHVGMIVGSARKDLLSALRPFIDPACR